MTAMRALLRLYPRAWRERYEDEMRVVLAAERPTLRLALDLIAGAVDARLNPQPVPRLESTTRLGGGTTMTNVFAHCRRDMITTAEHLRSAGWLLGISAVLAIALIALRARFGDTPILDAVTAAAFPIALVVSMRSTYFKCYSTAATWVMMATFIAVILAITFASALLAEML
jgi:hypothetical protein